MSVNEGVAARYRVDASRSRFIVEGAAEGLFSMFGHNPLIAVCGFGGDARFVPGTLEAGSLLVLAQADSLKVINEVSDKDRREMERAMLEEVLEAARYPEIVFMSTNISSKPTGEGQYEAGITGSLSLHGVTRSHRIDARLTINGDSLRAQGEFTLRQTDYNIKPVSVAGGTLKMKDELKLSFDIVASK
ncbi:MAG: YceI family protein [Pyrinomonadaceae bacterium]